jgi:excisionase family DNA binding protein
MNINLDQLPPVLTADEVAELLRCSRETVRRKTAGGEIPRIEGFHVLRYRRSDILAIIATSKSSAPYSAIGGSRR